MKGFRAQIAILLAVFFMCNSIQAYFFRLLNKTNKKLLIQIELVGSKKPFFKVATPGGIAVVFGDGSAYADDTFGRGLAGFCLGKIKYVIIDDIFLNNRELFSECCPRTILNNDNLLAWLDKHREIYPRKEAVLRGLSLTCASYENIQITEENDQIICNMGDMFKPYNPWK